MPFINFEVTEEEKEMLTEAANLDHMKATGWARVIALRTARQNILEEGRRQSIRKQDENGNVDPREGVLAFLQQIEEFQNAKA